MAGPLDEFVARIMRMVAAFTQENGLDQAEVSIELADGSRHLLATATAEPGFGFFRSPRTTATEICRVGW
jgi:hypothetical protein